MSDERRHGQLVRPVRRLGDDFDFNKLIAQLQQAMASMAGTSDGKGIDWSYAKATARHVAASLGPDPAPSQRDQHDVAEADRLASLWLDQHVSFDALTRPAAAWSRAEWVENTMGAWRTIAEPIVTRIADALATSFGELFSSADGVPAELGLFGAMMAPMLRTSAGAMYTAQLAQAMGKISGVIAWAARSACSCCRRRRWCCCPPTSAASAQTGHLRQ